MEVNLFARLDGFGRIVVKPGGSVFLFKEVVPVGNAVSVKVGKDILSGPKPTELGLPEPKVLFWAGLDVKPVHFGMINPSARIGQEGAEPGRGPPGTVFLLSALPPELAFGFGLEAGRGRS